MPSVHEVGGRGRQRGGVGKPQELQPLDDWLGDISDEDWDEGAAESAEQRHAAAVQRKRRAPEGNTRRTGVVGASAQARPVATTEARRARVVRRRAIAVLVVLLLVVLGAGAAALLVRDEAEPSVTTAQGPAAVTTPSRTDTDPVTTTPSTTPTTTTPSANAATFVLPEGTKLQRGESSGDSDLTVSTDPELIRELQRALATAGFEPGSPDGIFGQSTEGAVVAFQQANGLPVDGIVGPETADALNDAIAGG